MEENPLKKLENLGQSIWLDYIAKDLIKSGKLKKLIDEDGLKGITSNPAIFEKAFESSKEYQADIKKLAHEGKSISEIYDAITLKDVQDAADAFRPLYDKTEKAHGFVSLEVNPHFARDTKKTVDEARRLWKALNRPNVFIKVPGTTEGLPAITQLIFEGINVNVTLLFGLPRYREVALAYIEGIEKRIASGKPVEHVESVASFFLSRIDVFIDPILENIMKEGKENGEAAKILRGEIAIASAKQAYQIYKEIFGSERFKKLSGKNPRVQRLLWASTSTKNPIYSDIKYVEPLIGRDTVNTLPLETLESYRERGNPKARLEEGLDDAKEKFRHLKELGINIDQVAQQLEDEGIEKFNKPFDSSMNLLQKAASSI